MCDPLGGCAPVHSCTKQLTIQAIHAAITGEVDDDTDQPEGDDADQAADAPASAPSAAQVIEQCMAAKVIMGLLLIVLVGCVIL